MFSEFFTQAFIYLAAAVLAVPLGKRLGLGSALGYLIAGLMIGLTYLHWSAKKARTSCISPSLAWY